MTERPALISQAFRLEHVTLTWMTMEAAMAIWSGVEAGSLLLLAFGFDSLTELASAIVLIWRLDVELRRGEVVGEQAERTAALIGIILLFALVIYVVVSAGWKLWTRQGAEFSFAGLLVSAVAIPIMYALSRRKLRLADALGSRALRGDAIESITCGWLAFVVVAGLIAQFLIDAWWLDPLASLGIVWFLVREGREAWEGEERCNQSKATSHIFGHTLGQGLLQLLLVFMASSIVLIAGDGRREVRAEPQTARIVGLGATPCLQFNEDIRLNPSLQRDYLAWGQGYMSGILVSRPPGVDQGLDLNPPTFDMINQLHFLREYCAENTSANFADAVEALYKRLRREGKT